ncbi:3'-5' exonuclease family protein [Sphaerisporangium aureirubrum]|uniref:Uncharacterized protein n=1 Tax=Sphaerisporangium aureirubrum TaxID=1544736 RepID=A0ABW1NER0_9ACTN
MKIWYDTEFHENGYTIMPISIGLVAADDREYYAIHDRMNLRKLAGHPWVMANVVPHLPLRVDGDRNLRWDLDHPDYHAVKPLSVIAHEVRDFIVATPDVELWAWYGAFAHVMLAWLYGPMSDLPDGIPMWTNDLRQEAHRLGNPRLPAQGDGEHNALADARHNRVVGQHLAQVAERTTRA